MSVGRATLYQVRIDSRSPCPSQSSGFAVVPSLLLLGFPRALPPILPSTAFLLCQFYHMVLNLDREDPPPGLNKPNIWNAVSEVGGENHL